MPEPSNAPERFVVQPANGNATFVLVSRFHDPLAAPPVMLKIRFVPVLARLLMLGGGMMAEPVTVMVPFKDNVFDQLKPGASDGSVMEENDPR